MDTGDDFISPEFLHILFFQQKNLVIFPYVDLKHLHTLELFTVGYTPVDLESTALHDLKKILEFESTNSYSQSPTFYFIYNLDKDKVKEILSIKDVHCVLNSNEIITELAERSNFIFYNKKSSKFLNFPQGDNNLDFENYLISTSPNKEILLDKIQTIKNIASQIFTEINQNSSPFKLADLLKDYELKYWQKILDFTSRYFEVNLPPVSEISPYLNKKPLIGSRKDFTDFSEEYELIISLNRNIAKEFVQQLHEFRSKRVNPDYLELEELFSPQKLYNYLRNRHWKDGIPQSFIEEWFQMKISRYTLTDSDIIDFETLLNKLGISQNFHSKPHLRVTSKNPELNNNWSYTGPVISKQDLVDEMPSLDDNWEEFKNWIYTQIKNIEKKIEQLLSNRSEKEFLESLYRDLNDLQKIIGKDRKSTRISKKKGNRFLIVDITNILNEDKDINGKLKVENIIKIRNAIRALGYIPEMIADANMKYHLDNPLLYDVLKKKGMVKDAPGGREADEIVLSIAKQENCKFLTNDMYSDYANEFGASWIYENRLTCTYFNNSFIIR
ncbi:MAG: hypothetical protein ACFE8B_06910 [Candidatus Hermodarchaeota archaeon]